MALANMDPATRREPDRILLCQSRIIAPHHQLPDRFNVESAPHAEMRNDAEKCPVVFGNVVFRTDEGRFEPQPKRNRIILQRRFLESHRRTGGAEREEAAEEKRRSRRFMDSGELTLKPHEPAERMAHAARLGKELVQDDGLEGRLARRRALSKLRGVHGPGPAPCHLHGQSGQDAPRRAVHALARRNFVRGVCVRLARVV
mmetsp:Transcript_34611/g.120762  ORF Transcript_34611/g.120762 Transcript_34611/m.120762 type:complete len:201 (-) Transcript_34611:1008-1610(-)